MKLWLDDIRDPARYGCIGWDWVQTADQAIELLATGAVTEASLDHDLALEHMPFAGVPESAYREKTGYHVVCWMEEHDIWPENGVRVHSMNPVGKLKMHAAIFRHYGKLFI